MSSNILVSVCIGVVAIILGYFIGVAQNPPMEHQMSMAMHDMTNTLGSATDANFDQTFLREMIVHHEGAVTMAQDVLKRSQRPELRKLAEDIIAAQTSEIQQMKLWQGQWK